ncbi:MAG: hypothetical protein MUF57_10845 [Gammaproteobacteria bacterium]|nr:hypothetical protein [Gammaproteobacteria bacterium]
MRHLQAARVARLVETSALARRAHRAVHAEDESRVDDALSGIHDATPDDPDPWSLAVGDQARQPVVVANQALVVEKHEEPAGGRASGGIAALGQGRAAGSDEPDARVTGQDGAGHRADDEDLEVRIGGPLQDPRRTLAEPGVGFARGDDDRHTWSALQRVLDGEGSRQQTGADGAVHAAAPQVRDECGPPMPADRVRLAPAGEADGPVHEDLGDVADRGRPRLVQDAQREVVLGRPLRPAVT